MRRFDVVKLGRTKSPKTLETTSSRLTAVAAMITRSLTKMERCSPAWKASLDIAASVSASAANEAVARPPHGQDEGGPPGVVAELLAQAADQDVDRAVVRLPIDAARLVEDAVAAQHTAPVPHQEPEQLELRGGQGERAPVEAGGAGGPAHLQRANAQALLAGRGGASPQHRLEAGDQLPWLERLRQIVVRSHLQPDDPVHDAPAGGEHDDRDAAALADLAADGETVHAGEHHVENDDVGRIGLERAEPLVRTGDRPDGEAELGEILGEERVQPLVIIDDEHPHGVHLLTLMVSL